MSGIRARPTPATTAVWTKPASLVESVTTASGWVSFNQVRVRMAKRTKSDVTHWFVRADDLLAYTE